MFIEKVLLHSIIESQTQVQLSLFAGSCPNSEATTFARFKAGSLASFFQGLDEESTGLKYIQYKVAVKSANPL